VSDASSNDWWHLWHFTRAPGLSPTLPHFNVYTCFPTHAPWYVNPTSLWPIGIACARRSGNCFSARIERDVVIIETRVHVRTIHCYSEENIYVVAGSDTLCDAAPMTASNSTYDTNSPNWNRAGRVSYWTITTANVLFKNLESKAANRTAYRQKPVYNYPANSR